MDAIEGETPREKEQRLLLEEFATRQSALDKLDFDELLFGVQKAFIIDTAQFKVACCGRQSGKSHGAALALLRAAVARAGPTPVYINMNRASAQFIIWPPLQELNERYNLGLKFIKTSSDVQVPNGSVIKVFGAGSLREMDKIRGIGSTLNLVVLDEAQNFGNDMYKLIREILLPATVTHKAPILITGTPNAACAGPFYDIVHGGGEMFKNKGGKYGWSLHGWTMKENPHIPDVEEQYEAHMAANDWTKGSPAFRREYLGEWVRDTDGLCYYNQTSMLVKRFPVEDAHDWTYLLGVDVGTVDPWAFTVAATSRDIQKTYMIESFSTRLSTIEAGDEISKLRDMYPITSIVVDTGGQGANPVRQWKDTHPTLPIEPVKKGYGSVDMGISIMNADVRAGRLFFVEPMCRTLLHERASLIWDGKTTPTGARRVKRGDGYPDHEADAHRYLYTKVRTWKNPTYGQAVMEGEDSTRREALRRKQLVMDEKDDNKPFWQTLVKRA